MAASMLSRCVLLSRSRAGWLGAAVTGRRFLLSPAYASDKAWEKWEKETLYFVDLAKLMDKCYDRNIPVGSLVIARLIDNIKCREDIDVGEYYLYKFRHSPNCWYLRNWTVHGWIRKCLQYEASDKALYTLKNKVQFGIFPDNFTYNLLLDTFIKKEDFEAAVSVVNEIMLQESFDYVSTQLLSLYALHKYLSGNSQLTWEEEKNVGASLLLAGWNQENTAGLSSQLYGYTLLGKVELSQGLRAVYTQMPLMWTPGYFRRALDVLEKVSELPGDIKLCKDTIDNLKSTLESAISSQSEKTEETEASEDVLELQAVSEKTEEDLLAEYLSRFQELSTTLDSLGKIDPANLESLTTRFVEENLPKFEKADIEKYESCLEEWEQEQSAMIAREKELREKAKMKYESLLASRAKSAA